MGNGINGEPSVLHRFPHRFIQHQMLHIAGRQQGTLAVYAAVLPADIEEAFNLFVDATHRLHLTMLVHGAGNRQGLLERNAGDGGQQHTGFRHRGRIPFHATVGLFKGQTGRQ